MRRFIVLILLGIVISLAQAIQANELQLILDGDGWKMDEQQALHHVLASLPPQLHPDAPLSIVKQHSDSIDMKRLAITKKSGQFIYTVFNTRQLQLLQQSLIDNEDKQALFDFMQRQGLLAADDVFEGASRFHYLINFRRAIVELLLSQYQPLEQYANNQNWKRISGWIGLKLPFIELPLNISSENQSIEGFVHPYALHSPQADLLTVAAQFFVPAFGAYGDSIKCRLPKKYAFVAELFPSHTSLLEYRSQQDPLISCSTAGADFIQRFQFKDIFTGELINIPEIHVDNIEGFELIYATPGNKEISEIAGHLSIRIRIKNRKR